VTEQMAMYLLERHAQIDAQEACYVGAQAEELLAYNGSSSAPTAHSEAAAQACHPHQAGGMSYIENNHV
jgi:hypothetical protein